MPGVFADQGVHNQIYSGQKTVSSAGTKVQLTTSTTGIFFVTVKAKSTNTGLIYVGSDTTATPSAGFILSPGEALTFALSELSLVYIDASVSNEGVSYFAVGRQD